ncbi:hypothetical protein KR054_008817 [Drosophila jambulina]|nr:hypothetical protein KR054_008817 [Drosophila jambulina]
MELTYASILFQVAVALLAIASYSIYLRMTFFRRRGVPHDPPHFLRGNMEGFTQTRSLHQIIQEYYDKYRDSKAPFVGFYFFQKPVAFIMDLDLVKRILIKDFSNFSDKGLFYNEKDDPMTAHLFNLDGPQWRFLRNKLTSVFSSGKMKFMHPTVVSVAEEFTAVMHEKVSQSPVLEIRELVARFTVDVIGTCAFGIQCNSLRDEKAEFLHFGKRSFLDRRHGPLLLGFMDSYPKLARRLRLKRVPTHIHNFYQRIVYETVALREWENIRRNDFMDLLIDMKNQKEMTLDNGDVVKSLTIEEILAQSFVFFLAGFETSSSTMGFTLFELAKNPLIQDKVRDEVEEVLNKHGDQLTYESIKDLKYLHMVIDETSRLYSIASHLIRKAHRRYVVPGHSNFVIEAGQLVFIPATGIHHDPSIYPNPNEFQPERFSPEMVASRPSVAWLPFGDGPRNCLGMRFGQMQMRIALALLIKNFRFSTCPETPDPLVFDPRSLVLTVKGGIQLKVEVI